MLNVFINVLLMKLVLVVVVNVFSQEMFLKFGVFIMFNCNSLLLVLIF